MQIKNILSNLQSNNKSYQLLKKTKGYFIIALFFWSVYGKAQNNSLQANIEFSVYKGTVKGQFTSFACEKVLAPNTLEKNAIDKPGDFKIEVLVKSRMVKQLFFSSLASEWAEMCSDDSCKLQQFSESFRLDLPHSLFSVRLKKRIAATGKWVILDSASINPTQLTVIKPINYSVKKISQPSKKPKKLTIAFIPDGYGLDSISYLSDCKRFTSEFFNTTPFNLFKQNIAINALFFPTDTSSICTFKTLGIPRYLSVNKRDELAKRVAGIHADQLVVIYKSDQYGGSGFYNNYAVVSSSNKWSIKVFLHEFGHSFGGLGDEYVTDTAFCVVPNNGIDCAYPNVSSMPNGKVKWARLIKKSTPIPTPILPEYKNEVGVYEGASYCPHELYRPFQNCLMRELTPGIFCPVCKEAIIKRLTK